MKLSWKLCLSCGTSTMCVCVILKLLNVKLIKHQISMTTLNFWINIYFAILVRIFFMENHFSRKLVMKLSCKGSILWGVFPISLLFIHQAKIVTDWFHENLDELCQILWSAKSQDFNSVWILWVWDYLE